MSCATGPPMCTIDRARDVVTMTRPPIPSAHLTPPLEQRASNVMARASLRRELRSIALDLLGPLELDDCPGETADWVARTTEMAVSAVLDKSMEALIKALESKVAAAPLDVIDQLDQAAVRCETGID